MKYLFGQQDFLSRALRDRTRILLMLDYDGTLSEIAGTPELAGLPDTMKHTLERLALHRGITTGIISGRSVEELRRKVGIDGLFYSGNHGLEIEGPEFMYVFPVPEELLSIIRRLNGELSRAFEGMQGVLVEDKGLSLSVHYRLVPEHRMDEFSAIFRRAVDKLQLTGKIDVRGGKKVFDIRPPVSWNKGNAVEMLIRREAYAGGKGNNLCFYLGDDTTDEDGFQAVNRVRGISIIIGGEKTGSAANYFLRDTSEVETFLNMLLEISN
ncbi:MAG: trehalose-phosphatase [Dehalococcoidia bacterium]|nr:trehalose-phosphatase [Dehalococcoidia bacterium]